MGYADAVGDAIKGALCELAKLDDVGNAFFNELSPIDIPSAGRFWRPRLCDENPDDVLPPDVPFEGGQCECVTYRVTVRGRNESNPDPNALFGVADLVGPIFGVYVNGTSYGVRHGASACGGVRNFQYGSGGNGPEPFIDSVVRLDGLPDNCGDPPISIPPYPPGGVTIPISPTYITNEGDEISLLGDVTIFAPVAVFAPVTTVFAPVRVDLGGVTFDGTLELAPDFEFNFGTPPGDDSPGKPTPTDDPEDPDTSPDTDDDESNERLIGVYVRSRRVGRTAQTEIAGFNAPDLFVPRLASVYFRVRNRGTLGWLGPIDVKTTSAYIPVPANAFAVASRVDYESGWEGSKADVRRLADFGA